MTLPEATWQFQGGSSKTKVSNGPVPGNLGPFSRILGIILLLISLWNSVLFSSVTQSCLTLHDPWTAACQVSLFITNSQNLLKLISIEPVMPSNQLILCHPLLLPSIFPSIRVFSKEWVNSSYQVAKVLELQLQHQSFQWIFRIDFVAGRGAPSRAWTEVGSCLTLRYELSEEIHVLTKQEILSGKETQVESSRVREPRRIALTRGLQSRVLRCWD